MAEEDHGLQNNEKEAYSPFAIMTNNSIIEFCRTSLAAMAGISAGILGLTGLKGFIFYFAASILMSIFICWKAGSSWPKYFISWWDLSTSGIFGGVFTYLLFWTFLYGMVHVY
ncbi:ER membrane protein complex subunit 6 [Nematostella vectensis]|uniref:ER membrane protein complex subunit 6 n=1 Tax=Nematostella vectensis TaxID=45351 RepID=UPI00138FC465|nr:ER membrane protein complex subunit 6 [Nematostella vectensis]